MALSLFCLSLFSLTSFFSLHSLWFANCGTPMIVVRRLWAADGHGPVIVAMDRGSDD